MSGAAYASALTGLLGAVTMGVERNRFESSYATRLNRAVGLYFGLRRVEANSLLAGTEPPVVTEVIVVALLERAQRQNRLCPCQAPALAFALHPVLHHGTTGRLHDAGPDGQARGQVRVVRASSAGGCGRT